jgi:hypothetical protein
VEEFRAGCCSGRICLLFFLIFQRSVRENKTIALCLGLVLGGAAYSLYKRLSREGKGADVNTITRVVKKDKIQVAPPVLLLTLAQVDAVFLRRLARIGRIVLPSVRSTTMLHLVALTVLLYSRTLLSLKALSSPSVAFDVARWPT